TWGGLVAAGCSCRGWTSRCWEGPCAHRRIMWIVRWRGACCWKWPRVWRAAGCRRVFWISARWPCRTLMPRMSQISRTMCLWPIHARSCDWIKPPSSASP
ncbi:hypothetical protein EC988_008796, partial [Linderina pennispora]